jgi:hypothetical protein
MPVLALLLNLRHRPVPPDLLSISYNAGCRGSGTSCDKNTFPLQSVQDLGHIPVETNLVVVSGPLLRIRRFVCVI